jgi:hypothetical protein
MKPVSDMPCGSASSVTLRLRSPRVSSTVRRVESDSAAKMASRVAVSGLIPGSVSGWRVASVWVSVWLAGALG